MPKPNKDTDKRGKADHYEDDKNPKSNHTESEEFDFYYKFAKTLVLKSLGDKDCTLGAQWLKLLAANRNSKGAVVGVKLLILCLNRGFLSAPFDQPAPDNLCMFEQDGLDEMDIAHLFLTVGKSREEADVSNPPITTSLSSDFCQYVAVQEIPRFGIHCYFATSPDTIHMWNKPAGREVMAADTANPLAWEKCMAKISACIPQKKE